MKDPQGWRRAIIKRATDTQRPLRETVLEWIAIATQPPTTISDADAHLLARDSDFSKAEIKNAFTVEWM